jgi:hypothetical protein
VAHACNFSYLGEEDRRMMAQGQLRQKLRRPYLKNKPGLGVYATQEVELGGSWSVARSCKSVRSYLKKTN